jgi:hypothetical protein
MVKKQTPSTAQTTQSGPPASTTTWWTDRRLRWHASAVASLDDLPPPVKTALAAELRPGETVRQIISAPRQHLLAEAAGWRHRLGIVLPWDWTPDWVLVVTGQRLLVAASASAAEAPTISAAPITDLLSCELGTVLLFSWFEWTWADGGRPARQRIYFNTVSDRLFWDVLTFLRRSLIADADLPPPAGGRGLEQLASFPYKFRNLIPLRLLLPDEQICTVIYQPAIWTRHPGPFRRNRAPSLALILTNYHLVVTQEDLGHGTTSYGLITRYCPRDRIREVNLDRTGGDLWLTVRLARAGAEESVRVLFEPAAGGSLQAVAALLSQDGPPHLPQLTTRSAAKS